MANQKYAQVASMAGSGQLNWRSDHIVALLMKSVVFNAANTHLTDLISVQQRASSEIGSRQMGAGGEALGLPAVFPRVAKDEAFQVLVVKDVGDSDPMLLAFYDQDQAAGPLQMVNNGTLIVRPTDFPESAPPQLGIWFQI